MARRLQLDHTMGLASAESWGDMMCCISPYTASQPLCSVSCFMAKLEWEIKRNKSFHLGVTQGVLERLQQIDVMA